MKKSILLVLLMLVLALPVLANDKGSMEADAKLSVALNPSIKVGSDSSDLNTTFGLGGDVYYYVDPSVALGLGLIYNFDTSLKDNSDFKAGTTNLYFAVKPKIALESETFTCIYFLGQLGYAMPRANMSEDLKGGIYWGIGAGTEIQSFIVELIYGSSSGENFGESFTVSSINLNVGYKFII
ncbi:MAG: outer membrane beta-barrel protein [Endomicrobiaceae bacterium]|nr:outer membrane beta-barrel protein [Endomicrobiaceae bacterium]